jgi:hypothetical protein
VIARGKVVVAAGCYTFLEAAHDFFVHPEYISTLAPDALDSIKLTHLVLEGSEEGEVEKCLPFLAHLTGLREVMMDRSDCGDGAIARLAVLPNLQHISLYSTRIDGSCLRQLSSIKSLVILSLAQNKIKEESLQYLSGMPNLLMLTAPGCQLTDAGVANVSNCRRLDFLDISSNPKLSDGCVPYLRSLKKLHTLLINDTKISLSSLLQLKGAPLLRIITSVQPQSEQDLKALKKAFPGVQVAQITKSKKVDPEAYTYFAPLH